MIDDIDSIHIIRITTSRSIWPQIYCKMSSSCCIAFLVIFLGLTYLYQIIVTAIVVPASINCDNDSNIPPNPAINLSMQDWIYGGMIAGITVTAFSCASSRTKSNSNCLMGFVGLLYILYNFFTFIWSILGLIMYDDYYGQACKNNDNYQTIMNLGFYSGLVCSSIMIIAICLGCCLVCKQALTIARQGSQKLLDDDAHNVVTKQDNQNLGNKKSKIQIYQQPEGQKPRASVVPLTDAEQQRQRTLYGHIYHRIVGDRQIQ